MFMSQMFKSLRQAFESLFRLKMLSLVFVPPVISFFVILVVFIVNWGSWINGLVGFLAGLRIFDWLQGAVGLQDLSYWLALIFLILAFIPLVFISALVITSIFVMPVVLKEIEHSDFPNLEKKKGGSVLGSLWNTLFTTVAFVFIFVITLPLWLVPGLQVALPLLLTAWLNKRIFLYDVLQDFASKDERKIIEKNESLSMYFMGTLLALLSYFPFAFFFIPIISALAFTFHGLNALQELRKRNP